MNHSKLLRMNLAKPINQRLHVSPCDIADSIVSNRMAANYRHVRGLIEIDIAPKIEAMRKAQEIMDRIGAVSGAMPDCTIAHRGRALEVTPEAYHFGTMEPHLAGENDSFASVYKASSDKAFEHTQTTAGGLHASD